MKDLAYVPLDLPRIDIDYDEISEFFEEHKHNQYPFEETWEGIYLIGDVKDWDDPVSTRESFLIKYETDNARWNPKIPEHLLILFKQIIEQLPFSYCTSVTLLSQKTMIPPHIDDEYTGDLGTQPEPAGLKVMLSHHDTKSFFVMENREAKRQFIVLPEDTNSFAVSDRRFPHGAKKPRDKKKFILSCFGHIDIAKHEELVKRSVEKYEEYVIRF